MKVILNLEESRRPRLCLRKDNWLQDLLVFVEGRMRKPIRAQQSIATEIAVIGRVAKVATISKVELAISSFLANTLIDPIPKKAPLQARIERNRIPILLQVARAIAHGVRIFAHDNRTRLFGVFGHLDDARHAWIHGAEYIDNWRIL